MTDYTGLIPVFVVLVVGFFGALWFLDSFVSFRYGIHKGPHDFVFKRPDLKQVKRTRRNLVDITSYMFQISKGGGNELLNAIADSVRRGDFEGLDKRSRESVAEEILEARDLREIISPIGASKFRMQVFALRSLTAGRDILWVLSRRRLKETGEARNFPEDYKMFSPGDTLTLGGPVTAGFLEGEYYPCSVRIPKIEGIGKNLRSALFIPELDKDDPELVGVAKQLVEKITVIYPYMPTAEKFQREKIQFEKLVRAQEREIKHMQSEINEFAATERTANNASKTLLDMASGENGSRQEHRMLLPAVSMIVLPTVGTIIFGSLIGGSSGFIVGAIVGSMLTAFIVLARK